MAKTEERDHSNKCDDKKDNGRNSKSKDNDGCFECESKNLWKNNCLEWKEKRNKLKNAKVCNKFKSLLYFPQWNQKIVIKKI